MAINKRKILESAQKHLQKGALDKALEDYQTLAKADPRDTNIRLKLGDLQLKLGRTDDAIQAYLKVAHQFTNEGFDAKAVALYKQISKLDAKRHDVYAPLAELYQRMGLTSDAMKALQVAADAAHRSGDKAEALGLLRKMAALDPSNTTNRLKVADLLHQEGQDEEALAEYEAVVAELERQGALEERLRVLERMVALAPDREDVALDAARGLVASEQWAGAERLARAVLSRNAESLEARMLLGQALEGAGRHDESSTVMHELADRYRERGDEDRAREIMQRYVGVQAFSGGDTSEPDRLDLDDEIEIDSAEASDLSSGSDEDFFHDATPAAAPRAGGDAARDDETGDETFDLPAVRSLRGPPPAAPRPAAQPAPAPAPAKTPPAAKAKPAPPAPTPAAPAPAAPAFEIDPDADAEQLLAEASIYVRYEKHDRALASLRAVLSREPENRTALALVAKVLAAQGDAANAAVATERAARLAARDGDAEAFAGLHAKLAELDAAAAEAIASLAPAARAPAPPESEPLATSSGPLVDADGIDVEIEFDLDGESAPGAPAAAPAGGEIELPPGDAEMELSLDDAPRLHEEASAGDDGLDLEGLDLDVDVSGDDDATPTAAPPEEFVFETDAGATPAAEEASAAEPEHAAADPNADSQTAGAAPVDLTEDLEAAEFYFTQGMLPEARDAYARILEIAPGHPRAQLRLGEIAEALAAPPEPEPAPEADAPAADLGFDLDADDALEEERAAAMPIAEQTAPSLPHAPPAELEWSADDEAQEPESAGDFDLAAQLSGAFDDANAASGADAEEEGFAEVFAAFKQGVANELGDGDQQAHYDLGIAYREMGLLDDAIGEFTKAMSEPALSLASLHMMGLCALDLGRASDACAHLQQALSTRDLSREQRTALELDLGRAHAASGDRARARVCFEAVRAADPGFPDLDAHLAALDEGAPATESEADESLESFDDLLAESATQAEESPPAQETLESFTDLMDDDEADRAEPASPADASPEPAPAPPVAEPAPAPKRESRRKKISFV